MSKAGWAVLLMILVSGCAPPPKAQDFWKGRKPGLWRLITHSTATTDSVVEQCVLPEKDDVLDVPVAFPPGCDGPINFDVRDKRWVFQITCPIAPKVTTRFLGTVSGNFQDSYEIRMTVGNPDAPADVKPVVQTTQAVWLSDTCQPSTQP